MVIVIDIHSFRDANQKFIPKKVAVVAIGSPIIIIGLCYLRIHLMFSYPKDENIWLMRNYHGIEWSDGETNPKYFTLQLHEITKCACYIYVKVSYRIYFLEIYIYNLENISPVFKNLSAEDEHEQYYG